MEAAFRSISKSMPASRSSGIPGSDVAVRFDDDEAGNESSIGGGIMPTAGRFFGGPASSDDGYLSPLESVSYLFFLELFFLELQMLFSSK